MQVRPIEEPDFEDVRRVARASLSTSYDMVDESVLDAVLDELYARETLAEELERESAITLVATDGDDVNGFAQAEIVEPDDEGTIRWLHVHPDHRGEGVGSTLFQRTVDELLDHDVERLTANVLAEHDAGTRFYEGRDFERRSERPIQLGDETFRETEYVNRDAAERGLQPVTASDGRTVYVDREDDERGSTAPFYAVYADEAATDLWGWYCSACESADTAMDTMGRIACNGCDNRRKPTRWDAAYL